MSLASRTVSSSRSSGKLPYPSTAYSSPKVRRMFLLLQRMEAKVESRGSLVDDLPLRRLTPLRLTDQQLTVTSTMKGAQPCAILLRLDPAKGPLREYAILRKCIGVRVVLQRNKCLEICSLVNGGMFHASYQISSRIPSSARCKAILRRSMVLLGFPGVLLKAHHPLFCPSG